MDDPREAVWRLDAVRVVARRRRHRVDGARLRVQGDSRSALAAQCGLGDLLCADVDVEDEVVPGRSSPSACRSACPRSSRGSRSRRSGTRSPGARCRPASGPASSSRRPVTKPVRRVGAEVERLAAGLLDPVLREHGLAVGRVDGPRLILNCATRWIALSWRAASPGAAHTCQYVVATIIRRAAAGDERDAGDLLVHVLVFARSETTTGTRAARSSRPPTSRRTRRTEA